MRLSVQLSFFAVIGLTVLSNFVAIPANTNLLLTSFLAIYVGSHRRLVAMEVRPCIARIPQRSACMQTCPCKSGTQRHARLRLYAALNIEL